VFIPKLYTDGSSQRLLLPICFLVLLVDSVKETCSLPCTLPSPSYSVLSLIIKFQHLKCHSFRCFFTCNPIQSTRSCRYRICRMLLHWPTHRRLFRFSTSPQVGEQFRPGSQRVCSSSLSDFGLTCRGDGLPCGCFARNKGKGDFRFSRKT